MPGCWTAQMCSTMGWWEKNARLSLPPVPPLYILCAGEAVNLVGLVANPSTGDRTTESAHG